MQDLKQRALRGGFAKMCAQAANFGVRMGSVVVLARLLDPKDFGLVGMVTAVTGAFNLFKDAGLSVATVQRAEITDAQVSSLFWINILVGTILTVICIAVAPFLVRFYHEPRLLWVAIAIGSGFLVNAAGVQHSAILQRQMRFDTLAMIDVSSWAISVALSIGLALAGFGYWALVCQAVSLPFSATIGLWLATKWMPGPPRRRAGVGSMLRFGGTITVNSIVIYAAYNTDKILIGRLWGAAALGIYGRAYQLSNLPTDNLNGAVGEVAVSALSRVQNDPPRFKKYFLKSYSLVLALTLPVTMACWLFAVDLIGVLLGPKWYEAAPLFRLLAPTILAFAMINPLGWLLIASGRVRRSLKMALVIAPVVIAGYVLGIPYGVTGVALAYSATMTLLIVPMIAWATHGTGISLRDVSGAIAPPFVSVAAASVLSYASIVFLGAGAGSLARLLVGGGILGVTYVTMLLYVMNQWPFYADLLSDSRRAVVKRPEVAPTGLALGVVPDEPLSAASVRGTAE